MLAISRFTASDSGCPSDQAGAPRSALFSAEEAVGVQPERCSAEITQRVQRVTNDQPHARWSDPAN